mmetsp:Transcript_23367/g.80340  ORF Transcript_23367/g.80340 Transcript_23367/m.80340 type:complete len:446 (+) Transcript_23367:2357-3694(+)
MRPEHLQAAPARHGAQEDRGQALFVDAEARRVEGVLLEAERRQRDQLLRGSLQDKGRLRHVPDGSEPAARGHGALEGRRFAIDEVDPRDFGAQEGEAPRERRRARERRGIRDVVERPLFVVRAARQALRDGRARRVDLLALDFDDDGVIERFKRQAAQVVWKTGLDPRGWGAGRVARREHRDEFGRVLEDLGILDAFGQERAREREERGGQAAGLRPGDCLALADRVRGEHRGRAARELREVLHEALEEALFAARADHAERGEQRRAPAARLNRETRQLPVGTGMPRLAVVPDVSSRFLEEVAQTVMRVRPDRPLRPVRALADEAPGVEGQRVAVAAVPEARPEAVRGEMELEFPRASAERPAERLADRRAQLAHGGRRAQRHVAEVLARRSERVDAESDASAGRFRLALRLRLGAGRAARRRRPRPACERLPSGVSARRGAARW